MKGLMLLMLHCGGQLKTREEVFAVPVPAATATYAPLAYESFIVRIEKQLDVEGIRITEERLALSKNGQRLFGLMATEMPGLVQTDYGCVLGLRTSYDRSFANGVCIGAAVFDRRGKASAHLFRVPLQIRISGRAHTHSRTPTGNESTFQPRRYGS